MGGLRQTGGVRSNRPTWRGGRSYCAIRAATGVFSTGLALPPTNGLRSSFTRLPPGWIVRTVDHQLGLYVGEDANARKSSGSIHVSRVDVIFLGKAAYAPLGALGMIPAAAHSRGTHATATYDLYLLEPVAGGSSMPVRRDSVDRAKLSRQAFPTCFHILPAADERNPQEGALGRFGRGLERRLKGGSSAFHLAFTGECARFNALQEILMCNEFGRWQQFEGNEVIGAVYRDFGKRGKVRKNHTYMIVRVEDDVVVVTSAFDCGERLSETALPRAEANILFNPPGSSTVHGAQGMTVKGVIAVHQITHYHGIIKWLHTAVSRGTGPNNVVVLSDTHRSTSIMGSSDRLSWAHRKVTSDLAADVTAGGLSPGRGGEHRSALVGVLINSSMCNFPPQPLVWALHSEQQPTPGRLDCSAPHVPTNVDVKCLKCNRSRAGLGRGAVRRKRPREEEQRAERGAASGMPKAL